MSTPAVPQHDDHPVDGAHRRSALAFPVVGMGASAGGLAAALRFFEHMPARSGMAFVLVLHLSPQHASNAAEILQRATRMPVRQVTQTVPVEPDHVYVIAPALQLSMDDGQLVVQPLERPRGRHVAIDVFFRALARAHGQRAVAIVLSGTGSDGSVGLADIKAEGGVAIAQAPSDAEYDGMPAAAIRSDRVDMVLPVADMPQRLIEIWDNFRRIHLPDAHRLHMPTHDTVGDDAIVHADQALSKVLAHLLRRTGNDFRHYKRATLLRRLERRLQVTRQADLPSYLGYLESHAEETGALLQDLLISVTCFFRDRVAFEALERHLEAALAGRHPQPAQLRAWVPGCATGEEAYSVAITLGDVAAARDSAVQVQVFGSDIDERALRIARLGAYPEAIVNDVPVGRLRQHFRRDGGWYRVSKPLREQVLFARHNVLHDPPFSRLDLISCRNLLIYLERAAQQQVLETFHFALAPGGLLVLGSAESADLLDEGFAIVDKKHRIFRSQPLGRRVHAVPASGAGPAAPAQAAPPALPAGRAVLMADTHQRLIEAGEPASVVLDDAGRVMHTSPAAVRYLRPTEGVPSLALLDQVHPALAPVLRAALLRAAESRARVAAGPVVLEAGGRGHAVQVLVHPIDEPGSGLAMRVSFEEFTHYLGPLEAQVPAGADSTPQLLEQEIRRLHEELRGTIGDSTESAEALRASNEELQSINEELRSATEELETSKEELQSVNEELTTVNFELKAKVEESAKANDDLTNLISSMQIATLFVDRQMRIKRFTPAASEVFSILAADIGRPLLDLRNRLEGDALGEQVAQVLDTLRFVEREVRTQDGRFLLMRISPYRTTEDRIEGAVLNFVDVTELRRAQEQLRARDERLRLVAESTRDYAIITLDGGGRVTSWNRGAELMFGYVQDEILGSHFDRLFVPEDRAAGQPERELRQAREHGRALDERWHLRKDGVRLYVSGITTPFTDERGEPGFAKIARDLTERQLLERQREELLGAEQQVRQRLEAANAMRAEFLAIMSHELKNPLNLILMSAELIARDPTAAASTGVTRAVNTIRRTVRSQSQIIDDLLDLSRLNTGKLALSRVPLQLPPLIERIVEAVRPQAESQGLALSLRTDEVTVFADPVRVEQIVWNLLSNALKFTGPGGEVQVRLVAEGGRARLTVSDTGRGIEPQLLPRVFEMFEQGEGRSLTRREGGLGIGLALVRQLTLLHDGRVEADSGGPGRGARFTVWLPRFDGAAARGEHPGPPAGFLVGWRVLLVEDNLDILQTLEQLLRGEGAAVTAVPGAAQALDQARSQDFDLVISDLAMPEVDGISLLRQLRAQPHSAAWPAIAVSGFSPQQMGHQAEQAGFQAHLTKPLSMDELRAVVTQLAAPRPAAA